MSKRTTTKTVTTITLTGVGERAIIMHALVLRSRQLGRLLETVEFPVVRQEYEDEIQTLNTIIESIRKGDEA